MTKQTLDERMGLYVKVGSKGMTSGGLLFAASAVTGAGFFLIPPPAEAAIVYSGVQNFSIENTGSVFLDMDDDGIDEFSFFHSQGVNTNYQFFWGAAGSPSFVGQMNVPSKLVSGETVHDNNVAIATGSISPLAVEGGESGNFLNSTGFLGVRFEVNNKNHYGWIQYKANGDASIGTIIDWAYENVPGAAIKTGDTGEKFNWNLFLPAIINGKTDK